MSRSLYENHWGSPTLTLLKVLGVLGMLYVLNVLNVLYVLHGRIVGLLGLVFFQFNLILFGTFSFSCLIHGDLLFGNFPKE